MSFLLKPVEFLFQIWANAITEKGLRATRKDGLEMK